MFRQWFHNVTSKYNLIISTVIFDFLLPKFRSKINSLPWEIFKKKKLRFNVKDNTYIYFFYKQFKITVYLHRQLMREVRVVTNIRDGQYDISASTLLEDSELSAPLVVDCSLWIPHTSYTKHKTVNYHPGLFLQRILNAAWRCFLA